MADINTAAQNEPMESSSKMRSIDLLSNSPADTRFPSRKLSGDKKFSINKIVFAAFAGLFVVGMTIFLGSGGRSGGDLDDQTYIFTSADFDPRIRWVNPGMVEAPPNGTGQLVHLKPDDNNPDGQYLESSAVGCGIDPYNVTCESPEPVGIYVYTPPGYNSNRTEGYPVIYALHGIQGNELSFLSSFGSELWTGDSPVGLINRGEITESIVVFANGPARSGYIDSKNFAPAESLFVGEVIPFIDAHYNTIPKKEGRAVYGFSMGGFGALHLATKYPDLFGSVSALSSSCEDILDPEPVDDPSALPCDFIKNSIYSYLAENQDSLHDTQFLLANGAESDSGSTDHIALVEVMNGLGLSAKHIVVPNIGHDLSGHHNAQYFDDEDYGNRTYGQVVMEFISSGFGKGREYIPISESYEGEVSSPDTSELVGYWKFDEVEGLSVQDYSGENHDGILVNGPIWSAGKLQGGLTFDGYDDYVYFNNFNHTDNAFTIAFWVNHSEVGSAHQIYFRSPGSVIDFRKGNENQLLLRITTDTVETLTADGVLSQSGIWDHLAATWDGSELKLYKNGLEIASKPVLGNLSTFSGQLRISNSRNAVNGTLDEVHFYSYALSQSEIAALVQ